MKWRRCVVVFVDPTRWRGVFAKIIIGHMNPHPDAPRKYFAGTRQVFIRGDATVMPLSSRRSEADGEGPTCSWGLWLYKLFSRMIRVEADRKPSGPACTDLQLLFTR
jgi:hypothetical protein